MSRSKWKGPYYNKSELTGQSKALKKNTGFNRRYASACRDSVILGSFIGITYNVYNGKIYKEVLVTGNMVNKKFGEFAFTRAAYVFKKKKKKPRKKK